MINTALQYPVAMFPKVKRMMVLFIIGFSFPCYLLGFSANNITNHDLDVGTVSHFIWLDFDANGEYDFGEQILKNLTVKLYDAKTDSLLNQRDILDEGRFFIKGLSKGQYYLSLTFLDISQQHIFQPVFKDQLFLKEGTSNFRTATFSFDPNLTARKNIDIPLERPIQQAVLSSTTFTCTDFIDSSNITIIIENCDNMASICLDETIATMMSYTINDNGQTYNGGLSPCDFDTSFAYTYSGLPSGGNLGPYHVDSWFVNGVQYSGTVANMLDLTDSMNIWDNGGNWMHDNFTASIRGGNTAMTYSAISITQVATNLAEDLNITTTLNPNGTQLTLDTGYHQIIFTEPVEGCLDTLEVQIDCIPCPILFDGDTNAEVDNCNDEQAFCFDLSIDDLLEYNLSDNGVGYAGLTNPCSTDSSYRYNYAGLPGGGVVGPYLLQSWTVNNTTFLGGFNSVSDLVDSMNIWDVGGNWNISDPMQTITGGNPANSYSDIEVVQILTNTNGTATVEQLVSVNSIEIMLDTGFHEVVFYNTTNQCQDTFNLEVSCEPCPSFFNGMSINETAIDCDSTVAICLPIPFATLNDYNLTLNGLSYTNGFSICSSTDTEIQLDTGAYQLMLTNTISGCLDSVFITVGCTPPIVCNDFINETFVAIQLSDCNDTGDLCVEIPFSEIMDYSITDNSVVFTNLTPCLIGSNLALGDGFHELVFEHNPTGCKDTINSLVACLESETINSTVMVLESDTICLDTMELFGSIVSITNSCEQNSGEYALVNLDDTPPCVIIEGVEYGMEEACIVICDSYGFCDTTFINIQVDTAVTENQLLPVARDDHAVTLQGGTVNIVVFENDDLFGTLDTFGVINQPENGVAFFDNDFSIKYIPDPEFCTGNTPDSLTYYFCTEIACDTASVYIDVTCGNLKVHNGFSPNGDGQNDFFVIRNAHTDPDDQLTVFNRWGIRVLEKEGYQNDWNATWNGLDLPDGTYFYYYRDGQGRTASGYVLIQR